LNNPGNIDGNSKVFVEFLERFPAAEFSGFLLYKGTEPPVEGQKAHWQRALT